MNKLLLPLDKDILCHPAKSLLHTGSAVIEEHRWILIAAIRELSLPGYEEISFFVV
jgi:hypothetical protein